MIYNIQYHRRFSSKASELGDCEDIISLLEADLILGEKF